MAEMTENTGNLTPNAEMQSGNSDVQEMSSNNANEGQKLAGKFNEPQALEKGYLNAQKKLNEVSVENKNLQESVDKLNSFSSDLMAEALFSQYELGKSAIEEKPIQQNQQQSPAKQQEIDVIPKEQMAIIEKIIADRINSMAKPEYESKINALEMQLSKMTIKNEIEAARKIYGDDVLQNSKEKIKDYYQKFNGAIPFSDCVKLAAFDAIAAEKNKYHNELDTIRRNQTVHSDMGKSVSAEADSESIDFAKSLKFD